MTPEQFEAASKVMVQGPMLLFLVAISIVFIIYSTAKLKLHPFLAILFAAYGVGFLSKMPLEYIGNVISQGFGGIMTNIGLVIIFGKRSSSASFNVFNIFLIVKKIYNTGDSCK